MKDSMFHEGMKCIDIKHNYIIEAIAQDNIKVSKINTNAKPVNMMKKPVLI